MIKCKKSFEHKIFQEFSRLWSWNFLRLLVAKFESFFYLTSFVWISCYNRNVEKSRVFILDLTRPKCQRIALREFRGSNFTKKIFEIPGEIESLRDSFSGTIMLISHVLKMIEQALTFLTVFQILGSLRSEN